MINASRYNAFWIVLFAVGSAAACSSAGDDTGDGGGGKNNSKAGSSSGGSGLNTGGTPGSGGSGTSGSATAGSGTSGSATAGTSSGGSGGGSTACAAMKPASNLVTEFMDLMPNAMNAGQFTFTAGVSGGTFAYQPAVFTLTDATGALNIKGNVKNYDGFGVYFGTCMDASAYDGVSFSIKGNAGPTGKLSFRFQSNANMPVNAAAKKGACVVPAGTADPYPLCHDATFDITVAPAGGTVAVKFSDVTGGVPVATVDGKDLVGIELAFPWAGTTDTAYDVDVTLDDIKFTGGPAGGSGGGGGTGGGGGGGAGGGGAGGTQ